MSSIQNLQGALEHPLLDATARKTIAEPGHEMRAYLSAPNSDNSSSGASSGTLTATEALAIPSVVVTSPEGAEFLLENGITIQNNDSMTPDHSPSQSLPTQEAVAQDQFAVATTISSPTITTDQDPPALHTPQSISGETGDDAESDTKTVILNPAITPAEDNDPSHDDQRHKDHEDETASRKNSQGANVLGYRPNSHRKDTTSYIRDKERMRRNFNNACLIGSEAGLAKSPYFPKTVSQYTTVRIRALDRECKRLKEKIRQAEQAKEDAHAAAVARERREQLAADPRLAEDPELLNELLELPNPDALSPARPLMYGNEGPVGRDWRSAVLARASFPGFNISAPEDEVWEAQDWPTPAMYEWFVSADTPWTPQYWCNRAWAP